MNHLARNLRKIMIVDDSLVVRKMMTYNLEKAGYQSVEAVDGQDALDKLASESVDLLITDLNMPRLDGIALVREVRKNPKLRIIPIIMLTTEAQETKKIEGRAAGVSGWLVKPFNAEKLLTTVRLVLT